LWDLLPDDVGLLTDLRSIPKSKLKEVEYHEGMPHINPVELQIASRAQVVVIGPRSWTDCWRQLDGNPVSQQASFGRICELTSKTEE
jgi:hypothetical protein